MGHAPAGVQEGRVAQRNSLLLAAVAASALVVMENQAQDPHLPSCLLASLPAQSHPAIPRASSDLAPPCAAANAVLPSHVLGGWMTMRLLGEKK